MKTISNKIFDNLLSKLKPFTDSSIEEPFLESAFRAYKMELVEYKGDVVNDFGYWSKGMWVQCEPTSQQVQIIKDKLQAESDRLTYLKLEQENEDRSNHDFNYVDDALEQGLYTYGY